jgi:ubiquinone/menaquinone biosynthesis C-methylase UbiE
MTETQRYIPPLRYDWLTPIYDPVLRRMMPETELKAALIAQAAIGGSKRILDLGAGTGTLTLALKQTAPAAEVIGLDGDARVIEMARQKAAAAGLPIRFDRGSATALPYDSSSFDRVFASLMLHHLTPEDKRAALGEARRVLRPGGELHILDFGRPHNLPALLISLVMRHMEETRELIAGRFTAMLEEAGFDHVEELARRLTIIGTLSLYRGRKSHLPWSPALPAS